MIGVSAFISDHRYGKRPAYLTDGIVKAYCKGVGCIDNELYLMLAAELGHGIGVHGSGHVLSVMAIYLLQVSPGGIPETAAGFIGHLYSHAAFGGSSQDKNHLRNRCLNSWA